MKNLIASAAVTALLSTSVSYAGNLGAAIIEPEVTRVAGESVVAAETVSSSGGNLLVPLIAIAVIAALATGGSSAVMPVPVPGPIKPSDARLKTDITRVGTHASGLPIYQFRYHGLQQRYQGVMAQDVLKHTPAAVETGPGGFYMVNYDLLGLKLRTLN